MGLIPNSLVAPPGIGIGIVVSPGFYYALPIMLLIAK